MCLAGVNDLEERAVHSCARKKRMPPSLLPLPRPPSATLVCTMVVTAFFTFFLFVYSLLS